MKTHTEIIRDLYSAIDDLFAYPFASRETLKADLANVAEDVARRIAILSTMEHIEDENRQAVI